MEKQTGYIQMPIEMVPVKNGWYYVANPLGELLPRMMEYVGEWRNPMELSIKYYLQPVEGYFMTEDELLSYKMAVWRDGYMQGQEKKTKQH